VVLLVAPTAALAHKPSDSYLTLRTSSRQLAGEWHLGLRDLEDAIGLDGNDDGIITWGEVQAKKEAISAYALSRLHFRSGNQTGSIRLNGFLIDNQYLIYAF
jgi:hypothetical protein